MSERTPRRPSAAVRRARALLVGSAVGGHVAAVVCVVAFLAARGPAAGAWSALAAAVTLAFNAIGQGVQVAVADAPAKTVLVAALASYVLRVTVLGLLLQVVVMNAERFVALDPVAVVVSTIAVVVAWLGTEFWVYSRLRIPVYDEPGE